MSTTRPRIVIVGGGFAGTNLTRLLQKRATFAGHHAGFGRKLHDVQPHAR